MRWNRMQIAILGGLVWAGTLTLAHADKGGSEVWPTVILPEVTTKVRLSNTDVNRLVCPDGIKDVVFSQEKGVKVKITDGNAFLKFQVIKKGEEMIYTEVPSEFYVVCGGDIYSLVGMPQRVPAQTIRLSSGKKQKIQQNLTLFNGMPLEKKILTLIRQTYTDQLPESYEVRVVNRQIDIFPALWMSFTREIVVEGEGLAVREYRVSLKSGMEQIRLSEQEFLRSELTNQPLAVAVDELLLSDGRHSRVFVVERRDPDSPSPMIKQTVDKDSGNQNPAFQSVYEEGTDGP
jgi:conjugal transfer pilus assembly protein TraK